MAEQERKKQVAEIVHNDPHAPHYHFIAPEGRALPFDPNGALFWKGAYHIFYIFQDPDLPHGGHCWGHASSADLLHWTYHPTALAPAEGDPDTGIFSGGAFINKEGVPTIIYHGVGAGTCIATAEDEDLIQWQKNSHNPVIPEVKEGDPGWGVYNVFDPHAWVEGDTYYAILGGKVKPHNLRDTAYLFTSKDLIHWQYERPFYNPHPHWTGEEEDCACPDFFPIGDKHALVCISHPRGARYYLGRYHEGTFVPEEHHRMNWPGGSCFAPESLLDDKGRRIFWAWVIDQRKGEGIVTNELGVMTMPRVLSLDNKGRLRIEPPEEFAALRQEEHRIDNLPLENGALCLLEGIDGDVVELCIEAQPPENGIFGVRVRVSPDNEEQTTITVDTEQNTLTVDTTETTVSDDIQQRYPIIHGDTQADVRVQEAPFELAAGEPLKLRIFLDKSILEVYANGRQCVTQRIYPSREDSLGTAVFSHEGDTTVYSIQAWDLASVNGA